MKFDRGTRRLHRLETLTDVVYGVMLLRIFVLLPKPGVGDNPSDLAVFFDEKLGAIAVVVVGFAFTIIHWMRNNDVFGLLERTDKRHTIFSLLQLISVLLFLYAVRMGVEYDGDRTAMIFESACAALMGGLGIVNWYYSARDRRLLADDVTDDEVKELSSKLLPEPIAAVLTIPCAFLGPGIWTLSWFVLGWVVRRFVVRR